MSKLDIFLLDQSNNTKKEFNILKPKTYKDLLNQLGQKYKNISNFDLFIFDKKNNEIKINNESKFNLLNNILFIREKQENNLKLDQSIFEINYNKLSESRQEILDEKYSCILCSIIIKNENPFLCYKCQKIFHEKCLKDWDKKCKSQNKKLICPNCRNELSIENWNKKINYEDNRKEDGNLMNKYNKLKNKIIKQNELIQKYEIKLQQMKEEKNKESIGQIEQVSISGTETILNQMKNCICYIKINDINGTGFFCKINYKDKMIDVLMTNYHILNEKYYNENNELNLFINDNKDEITLNLKIKRKTYFNKKYDLTMIELKKEDDINNYLQLDNNLFKNEINELYKDISIYTLQYSSGKKTSVSYELFNGINKDEIKYQCNIENSFSGSPILNLSNNKVIGIYKQSDKNFNYNIGTCLQFPLNNFFEKNEIDNNNNNIKEDNEENNKIYIDRLNKYEKTRKKSNEIIRIINSLIPTLKYQIGPGPKINVIFITTRGTTLTLALNYGTTLDKMIKIYLIRIGQEYYYYEKSNKIYFLYNGNKKIKFGDKTLIENYFINVMNPKIVVNNINDILDHSFYRYEEYEEYKFRNFCLSLISEIMDFFDPKPKYNDYNENNSNKDIAIIFNKGGKLVEIKMPNYSFVAELINEYFKKTKTINGTFIFNNAILPHSDIITLSEVGLKNNSEIIVK